MNENTRILSLDELSELTEQSKRTIRYYIQIGLLDKPTGVGRGSHYSIQHLNQLLEIRKWQQAGLSLERIQELLNTSGSSTPIPPQKPRKSGTIEVWTHIVIDQGIELMLEPSQAKLSPEQVNALIQAVITQFHHIKIDEGNNP